MKLASQFSLAVSQSEVLLPSFIPVGENSIPDFENLILNQTSNQF